MSDDFPDLSDLTGLLERLIQQGLVVHSPRNPWWEGVPGLDRHAVLHTDPDSRPLDVIRFLARCSALACGIRVFGPEVATTERVKWLKNQPDAPFMVIREWYYFLAAAESETDAAVRRLTLLRLCNAGVDPHLILGTLEVLCEAAPYEPFTEPEAGEDIPPYTTKEKR